MTSDTKATLRQVLDLHRSGRTAQAVEVLDGLLETATEDSRAWFLAGFLRQGLGRREDAEPAYRRSLELEPGLVEARLNLAQLLRELGRTEASIGELQEVLRQQPGHPGALNNLGLALADAGRIQEAEQAFRSAVTTVPGLGQAWNNLGNLLDRAGRHAEAREAFVTGIGHAGDFVPLRVSLGRLLRESGRMAAAEEQLREAVRRAPEAALPRAGLAELLLATDRGAEAKEHLDKALALAPEDMALRRRLASALFDGGRVEEAVALLEAARGGSGPAAAEGLLLYADCLERLNRVEEARAALEQVPEAARAHSRHALVTARIAEREDRLDEAIAVLEAQLEQERADDRARNLRYELGRVRDLAGDAPGAMQAFDAANAAARRVWRESGADDRDLLDRIRGTREALASGAIPDDWVRLSEPEDLPFRPVFLVGFPRSGTTLLDRVLAAHPQVSVIEERPTLSAVNRELQERGDGAVLRGLASLDGGTRDRLRKVYAESVAAEGVGDAEVVVDKHPMRAWHLPVLHRLFPEARFLVGLRHPCDSVLSCYMQAFHFSPAMAQFHTLEDGAGLYDLVIGTLCEALDRLPVEHDLVRYEDLVEDLEGQARAALGALGLDWDPGVLDFHRSAQDERRINNPSYKQVSRPIYRQARLRWHRYRERLEPVLPVLEPYIRRFGYADDLSGT